VQISATPSVICSGNTAQLSASGGTAYTWMPGTMNGSLQNVSPLASTVYTVSVSDGTCSGTASVSITTKPNPTLTIASTATRICSGESLTLTTSGAVTYTWNQPNLSGTFVVDTPTISTGYQVLGTNSVGCTSGAFTVAIVDQPPTLSGNLTSTLVCTGGTVMLTGTGATNYTWSSGPQQTESITIVATTPTVYTLYGTSGTNTCTASRNYSINVVQSSLAVSPSTAICIGTPLTLTATAGGSNYNWQPGGGSSSNFPVTSTLSTVYTVSANVTVSNVSCPASNMVTVTINPNPVVTAAPTRTAMCRNEKNTFNATGASSYLWQTATTSTTGTSVTYTNSQVGVNSITLTGTDANGCVSSAMFQVQVNFCNSLQELEIGNKWTLYPNPSNGEIRVLVTKEADLLVINQLGQAVREIHVSAENTNPIKLNLPAGVYFIIDKAGTYSEKLIVRD
jgi:hypothetical protein